MSDLKIQTGRQILQHVYKRFGILAIDEVLKDVTLDAPQGFKKRSKGTYHGQIVKLNSERYKCFKHSGIVCVKCQLEAKYFAVEKQHKELGTGCHFNLYGIDDNGDEVLFTKDHIVAKANGGEEPYTNYQTMCSPCNGEKSNSKYIRINIGPIFNAMWIDNIIQKPLSNKLDARELASLFTSMGFFVTLTDNSKS